MKKVSLILSILIAIILIMSTYTYATVNAKILAKASKTTVQPGDEVEISLYLKDLEFTNKGVDEVEIGLNISKDSIENLTVNSIVTENGILNLANNALRVEDVSSAKYDEALFSSLVSDYDYKIFLDLKNPITDRETKLLTLKCKIKETAKPNVDIENAISFNVDLLTQVTAADLKDGMTADKVYALKDNVTFSVKEKTTENKPETPTDKPATDDKKDDPTNKPANDDKKGDTTNKPATDNKQEVPATNKPTTDDSANKPETPPPTTTPSIDNNPTPAVANPSTTLTTTTSNDNNNGNAESQVTNIIASGNPTTAKSSIPAAGLKFFVLPIFIAIGIVIFSYKKYMKYKDIK